MNDEHDPITFTGSLPRYFSHDDSFSCTWRLLHRIALEAAFTLKNEYGYKELAGVLRETYATVDVILGGNRVTDLITLLKNKRMIVQENGRKYTFKPDFHY